MLQNYNDLERLRYLAKKKDTLKSNIINKENDNTLFFATNEVYDLPIDILNNSYYDTLWSLCRNYTGFTFTLSFKAKKKGYNNA